MPFSIKKLFFSSDIQCSTWNIAMILIFSFLLGCKEDDPKPELKDNIYQDMVAQEGETIKQLAEVEKKLEEYQKNINDSKPQTGELRRNTRKYYELKNIKDKILQQLQFWKIRKYERLKFVRRNKTQHSDEEWKKRVSQEYEVYLAEKKLRLAKSSWDLKQRFREGGFEYNPELMGEGQQIEKKEKPAAGAGGGGH